MAKRRKKLDSRQRTFDFNFERRVTAHLDEKAGIIEALNSAKPPKTIDSYEEACIELAKAVKLAVRQAGISREELLDRINDFFGWPEGDRKALSIHMLNHYLSKPTLYPMPGAFLFAIQYVTDSLEPCRALAEAIEGDVISREEKNDLLMGKLDKAVYEMQRLRRQLRRK